MVKTLHRSALLAPIALLSAVGSIRAEEAASTPPDTLPGSPVSPGLGLAPQAPPVGTAPGGRATPFGGPTEKSAATFRIGGRFYGWEAIGIGKNPSNPPVGYSGTPLHAPLLMTGKIPFWGGSGATLNLSYGTPTLTAVVSYYYRVNRQEGQGYNAATMGPSYGIAYLLYNPDPIGTLKLTIKAGSFVEVYAGPGQWGWGIFGPMLALRGYGETTSGDMELSPTLRLNFAHGVLLVPGVAESFPRGNYNSWIETGVSSYVHHAHVGAVYDQTTFKLHYASVYGTDERKYLKTFLNETPKDGRFDAFIGEFRWQSPLYGQLGVSGALYNYSHAASVHDGVWWAVDWTQGAREMINKYLGPASHGSGKVAVVGAEYNFSIAPILWHPRTFNNRAPDIRISLAGMVTRTLDTADQNYKDAMGYFFGVDTEYRMTRHFSLTFQSYGETRPSTIGQWSVYSLNPGIAYRMDWQSMDRIQLIYGRRFYSTAADPNSAMPMDPHMIAIGGYVTF